MIDGSAASQEALRGVADIRITGTLQYQACDDKICYTPVSVPLSWTIGVRTLDRERPNVAH